MSAPDSRFSENAQEAILTARRLAIKDGSAFVTPSYLLLGILSTPGSSVYKSFLEVGLSPDSFREKLITKIKGAYKTSSAPIQFDEKTHWILNFSGKVAVILGSELIGTHHLLLTISCCGDWLTNDFLTSEGIEVESLPEFSKVHFRKVDRLINKPVPNPSKMSAVHQWALEANEILSEEGWSYQGDIATLRSKVETTKANLQRNLMIAVSIEIAELGAVQNPEIWQLLRLTRKQAEAIGSLTYGLRELL